MASLIVFIVFGLLMGYFATQNTQQVSVMLANYELTAVPLYGIVLAALLIGVFVSWILSFFGVLSSLLKLHKKDNTIKAGNKQIENMEAKIRDLEKENTALKAERDEARRTSK